MTILEFAQGSDDWHRMRKRAITDLYWFCANVLGLSEHFALKPETHILPLRFAERRTGIADLDEAPYQLILWPRDCGKSSCVTVGRTLQRICENPNIAVLIANEKEETAADFLAAIKNYIETNDFLRHLFPEIIPPDFNKVTWAATRADVHRTTNRPEPTIDVTGVGGTKIGKHPDLIVCDDLISRESMENARSGNWTVMHKVNRWINQLVPLLSHGAKPFPQITFIGTRWWTGDSYEHIEKVFGRDEDPRRYRIKARLPSGQEVSREAYRVGNIACIVISAIEKGSFTFPDIWPEHKVQDMLVADPELAACLPPGEKVLTAEGEESIECLRDGDEVITHTGECYPVVASSVRPFAGDLVEVTAYGQGTPILITPNHKLLAEKVKTRVYEYQSFYGESTGKEDWYRADELSVGDVVSVPIPQVEIDVHGVMAEEDFWFLVGHFIGDGSVARRVAKKGNKQWPYYKMEHCFNKKDVVLADKISKIVQHVLGRKATIRESNTTLKLSYSHRDFGEFFFSLRHEGWAQKWLPSWCERLPRNLQQALVDGYWAADGCEISKGRRIATSVCRPWLCQLQRILARLGVMGYLSKPKPNTRVIEGRKVNAQPLYLLWVYTKSKRRGKAWIANGRLYRRIRKLQAVPYSGPVYNCEVVENHSYVSPLNAITYKNCNLFNNPSNAAIRTFQDEWLRYWRYSDPQGKIISYLDDRGDTKSVAIKSLYRIITVDPAASSNEEGARNAIVVLGTDQASGKHFVLDTVASYDDPEDLIATIVSTAQRWGVTRVYIELAGQQLYAIQWTEREAKRRNYPIAVEPLKPGGRNKDLRISGLVVPFKGGDIYVHGSQSALIVDEYRHYRPGAKKRDVLDALAYAMEVAPKPVATQHGMDAEQRSRHQLASYLERRGMRQFR